MVKGGICRAGNAELVTMWLGIVWPSKEDNRDDIRQEIFVSSRGVIIFA